MYLKREEKYGRSRDYYTPYPLNTSFPNIEYLVKNPGSYRVFIEAITRNHEGLNWKSFRRLNRNNYRSFIFAFAYEIQHQPASHPATWQFESNARRLNKALKRANVELSSKEEQIVNFCQNFRHYAIGMTYISKKQLSLEWQNDLILEYCEN